MYPIVWLFFKLLSLLPFWILYRLSDFFFFLLYYVVRYRRNVVWENISNAFPDYSEARKKEIIKTFFLNLTDYFVETIKLLSISKKELEKRIQIDYRAIINAQAEKKSLYLLLGHTFNWEWGNIFIADKTTYKNYFVFYLPLSSKVMDRLFSVIRKAGNVQLLSAYDFRKYLSVARKETHMLSIMGDQRPLQADNAYWVMFLNRKTPFINTVEKSIAITKATPIFGSFSKIKRGYYKINTELLEIPTPMKKGTFTKMYAERLERQIRENPPLYLWSHKRWKFEYNAEKHTFIS